MLLLDIIRWNISCWLLPCWQRPSHLYTVMVLRTTCQCDHCRVCRSQVWIMLQCQAFLRTTNTQSLTKTDRPLLVSSSGWISAKVKLSNTILVPLLPRRFLASQGTYLSSLATLGTHLSSLATQGTHLSFFSRPRHSHQVTGLEYHVIPFIRILPPALIVWVE